ncbi:MAG TPA: hypothetical protein VFE50_26310 [Cyclobacteriaceae bacterium]|nr:hypothetical protein [Cyclobacteriaceae bacterium]
MSSCSIFDKGDYVDVKKPRLHKTWPRKHRWHKKLKVRKFKVQMPERGGVKTVKMKS